MVVTVGMAAGINVRQMGNSRARAGHKIVITEKE
jgi:hypothetical protein